MGKLCCAACSKPLDRKHRPPVALPACGHTACRRCLIVADAAEGSLKCPTCRKDHTGAEPEDLPANFALLQLIGPEEEATEEMEKLDCPVCSNPLNHRRRAPVALPACGHTACRRCLIVADATEGRIKCPICRKDHTGAEPEDLPANFALLQLIGPEEETSPESSEETGTTPPQGDEPPSDGPGQPSSTQTILKYGCAAVVGGAGALALAPVALTAVGFTSAGIAANSLAASIMSSSAIASGGGVVSGGVVATLQSIGAAGLGATGTAAVGSAGAAVGAGATKAYNYVFGGDGDKKN